MRLTLATTVKTAALVATLSVGIAEYALAAKSVDAPAEAAVAAPTPAFDPAAMPEVQPPKQPLGYRYADLTSAESNALRRGFKLPLDALIGAKSPKDLVRAAVVAPLPDPNKPLLAVSKKADSTANPFADSEAISFRRDPLKALGAMLGAVDDQPAGESAAVEEENPFGLGAEEAAEPAAAPAKAEVDDAEDPFGAESDPFGSGDDSEDPFAGF